MTKKKTRKPRRWLGWAFRFSGGGVRAATEKTIIEMCAHAEEENVFPVWIVERKP